MPSLIRDKSGTFFIVYSIDGKRVWRSTKTKDKREALKVFSSEQTLGTLKPDKKLSGSINEFLQYSESTQAKKTFKLYKMILNRLLSIIGDTAIKELTMKQLDNYKASRLKKISSVSVNVEIRALKTFFNRLKRWEIIEKNPCDGLTSVRIPEVIPPYLSEEQLKILFSKISDPWLYPIVKFAAMTGLRLGELLNLTWENVDLENQTALIRSSLSFQTKAGKLRRIPLNQSAMEILLKISNRDGFVFHGKRGRKADPNFVSRKFREIIRKGNFDRRIHFHSLRHSFGSLLVKKGVSLFQVQKLLGHSSPQMTMIYAHLQTSELRGAVDLISINDQ